MSLVLNDARFLVDGYDLSGDGNEVAINRGATNREFTAFGPNATRIFRPGHRTGDFRFAGFQTYGTNLVDDVLRQRLGRDPAAVGTNPVPFNAVPILVSADGGDFGERCHGFGALAAHYTPISGKAGEPQLFEISGTASADLPVAAGVILEAGKTPIANSGTNQYMPAVQAGAIGATQKAYGIFQILAATGAGAAITLQIVSATNQGLTGVTPRLYSNIAAVAPGSPAVPLGTFSSFILNGPITDTWWALKLPGGGTYTSVTVAVAIVVF